MTTNVKLKDCFEVESKYSSFFTGGNIEWLTESVILCQNESTIQFLNIETGTVTHTIGESTDETEDNTDLITTFTSNSNIIITAHKNGLLKQWKHAGTLEKQWKSIHKGPISTLSLDKNNSLASGGSDGIVRIWNTNFQSCTHSLRGCNGVVSVIVHHPTKNQLFAAGDNVKIICWDIKTSTVIKEYCGHFSKITAINFSNDCKFLISSGRDKVVIFWDLDKTIAIKTVPVFESVESVIVLPEKCIISEIQCYNDDNDVFVATAGEKGVIRIWNLNKSKEVYVQNNSLVPSAKEDGGLAIIKLLFNHSTKMFCVVSVEHNIILHDLSSFACVKQFVGFSDEILDVCFIGKGETHLAVATNSSDIKLYEYKTMNCNLLQGHTDIVLALAKTISNPNLLISSAKDNSIRLWLLNEILVTCIGIGTRHTGSVGSVAFSQTTSKFVVSVSQDTCLKMWEIPQNNTENQILECLRTEIAHQKDINCVTVSPNDKIIATGSQDKLCKLWSENFELLGVLRGHKRGIWCVRFSPIDQIVLTSSADCTVKLWSINELNCLKTLQGHESSVLKMDFLTNGMQILTSGADGFLKLFSVKTSECTVTLDEHSGRVWALAVKSDESIIISGGSDSLLVKWKDVTVEKRIEKTKELEELALQEQQLSNLVHNNELLKALKLALRLDRPFQTLKIIEGIIKKGDTGLPEAVSELSNDQKELLLKCATTWNTNSKHCQSAQLILNILLNELQSGKFRPIGLSNAIESTLPYTERHYKRLTQLMQDLYFINYTVNCMQPNARNN